MEIRQNAYLEVNYHEPFVWGDAYEINIASNNLKICKNEDEVYRIVLPDFECQNIIAQFKNLLLSSYNVEINSDGDRYSEPGASLYLHLSDGHISHTVELSGWSNHQVIYLFLNRIFEIIPKFKFIYDGNVSQMDCNRESKTI